MTSKTKMLLNILFNEAMVQKRADISLSF